MVHLLHLPVHLATLHEVSARRGWIARGILDEGLALHHLLGETFGPGVVQPFRLMPAPRGGQAAVYGYAANAAADMAATARLIASPEALGVFDLDALRSKPMPEVSDGTRVGFDLRLRPIVRLAKPLDAPLRPGQSGHGKGDECDAFVARALRGGTDGLTRADVYLDWLTERLDGAELERPSCVLARFRREVVLRTGVPVEGPDAVIHGTLRVTDAPAFAAQLASGVGRHRAYGYGMLLLRAPQRPPSTC